MRPGLNCLAVLLAAAWLATHAPCASAFEIQAPSPGDTTLTVTGIVVPEPVGSTGGRASEQSLGGGGGFATGFLIGFHIRFGTAGYVASSLTAWPSTATWIIDLSTPVSPGDFFLLFDVLAGVLAGFGGQVAGPAGTTMTAVEPVGLTIEGFTEGATSFTVRGMPAGCSLRARYVAPGGSEVTYLFSDGSFTDQDGEANGEVTLRPLRSGGPPYVLAGDAVMVAANDTPEIHAGSWVAGGLGVRYTVPVASHVIGSTGVPFISDLSISNPFGVEAGGWIRFVPEGGAWQSAQSTAFSLAPGESISWEDVLRTAFGLSTNVKGTLLIGGMPLWQLAVSSRNYAVDAEQRRFGIAIAGVPSFEAETNRTTWVLPGLREGGGFRTNLIVAGATPEPSTITLRIIADGQVLATASRDIPGYGLLQINRVATALGAGEVDDAYVEMTVGSGGVFSALSVVDASADDAAFIRARPLLGGS